MPHFAKPAEGSWTEHYPQLGTAPVSYEDSISPEHYELERKAIFARTWLNVGRVEQLPRAGSYFTREIHAVPASVVVVRGTDGEVRAFHNICRHRGNKLVWQDYPREETAGTCRQFTCKYHGWRYGLDGSCNFVQQEREFFDLDREAFGLVPVRCDVWEGFIFVNLDADDATPLRDYLGRFGAGLEGYPFGEMTQAFNYRAEVGSNWASKACTTSSTGRTAWCRRGEACRPRRTRTWSSRSNVSCTAACSGRGRDRSTSTCRPESTRPATPRGASTRSSSSPTS